MKASTAIDPKRLDEIRRTQMNWKIVYAKSKNISVEELEADIERRKQDYIAKANAQHEAALAKMRSVMLKSYRKRKAKERGCTYGEVVLGIQKWHENRKAKAA